MKAVSKSASLTSLTMLALPIPFGIGKRWPMEFFTRSSRATLKNSQVKRGLYTGTSQPRNMFLVHGDWVHARVGKMAHIHAQANQ